ncbi:MAG: hypothetical protein WAM79_13960 [Candidatus Sulfotelmatobacter sp.]
MSDSGRVGAVEVSEEKDYSRRGFAGRELSRGERFQAEALAAVYVAAVAGAAHASGISFLLFPELGALAYDVLMRPWGKWARQPVRLVLTPAITAVIGTMVTRWMPFNGLSVILIVGLSAVVIAMLRSSIAPAMSAGVLPMVLGMRSWVYPEGMTATLVVLSAIAVVWRKYHSRKETENTPLDVEDVLESPPRGKYWVVVLLIFAGALAELARITGLRFILFPPLVTIAYEMFGHTEMCPWTKRPVSLPACCFLTAGCGLLAFHIAGTGVVLALCSMVAGIVVLRLFELHMPPALAVGLLPAVMIAPNWKFPFAVLAGTVCLTVVFLGYRRVVRAG